MALHHIRDSKGNLHYFNDEEYRQYLRDKRRTGCFVFLIIAALFLSTVFSHDNDDKSSSRSKTEQVVRKKNKTSTRKNKTNNDHDTITIKNDEESINREVENTESPAEEIIIEPTITEENIKDKKDEFKEIHLQED